MSYFERSEALEAALRKASVQDSYRLRPGVAVRFVCEHEDGFHVFKSIIIGVQLSHDSPLCVEVSNRIMWGREIMYLEFNPGRGWGIRLRPSEGDAEGLEEYFGGLLEPM